MKRKVCEYCGTEYALNLEQCPLCGRSDAQEKTVEKNAAAKAGARLATAEAVKAPAKSEDGVPQWMWALICGILTVAVLIGLVYFLLSMGYLGGKTSTAPVETTPVEQPVETEPEVPVVEEPEDLSCEELTLNQYSLYLDELGGHVFLTAFASPIGCKEEITYISEDEEVAIVDEDGMITAVGPGETSIAVTCGEITEKCTVVCDFVVEEEPEKDPEETPEKEPEGEEEPQEQEQPETTPEETVQKPETTPELSSVDFTLFRPSEETILSVKNAPDGAVITYTSSDPSVASVTDTGRVTATGNGTATITVMVNDLKLTCVARCNLAQTAENNNETPAANAVYSLSHVDASLFSAGENFLLVLADAAGNKAAGVGFASSNTAVCTVDGNGRVTAVGKGTANVTASYGGKTYVCIVRCPF